MDKDNNYYRTLDLRGISKQVPLDKATRAQTESFHEMLIALALRCNSEPFTDADLLAYLGEPDAIKSNAAGEVWEYAWRDEHCSREYLSSTPFVLKDGRVIGVKRDVLTPAS